MPSKGKIRSQLLDRYVTFNERFLHYLHHESIPFWAAPQPDYIFTSIFHAPFFSFRLKRMYQIRAKLFRYADVLFRP
jgi:hypothetical protein